MWKHKKWLCPGPLRRKSKKLISYRSAKPDRGRLDEGERTPTPLGSCILRHDKIGKRRINSSGSDNAVVPKRLRHSVGLVCPLVSASLRALPVLSLCSLSFALQALLLQAPSQRWQDIYLNRVSVRPRCGRSYHFHRFSVEISLSIPDLYSPLSEWPHGSTRSYRRTQGPGFL